MYTMLTTSARVTDSKSWSLNAFLVSKTLYAIVWKMQLNWPVPVFFSCEI